jgi:hypothetical protein
MKNKYLSIIFGILVFCHMNALSATQSVIPITFVLHWDNSSQLQNSPAHLPSYSPNVTLEDYTLHFYYNHPDCTVQLLDDDEVVFEEPFFPYTANNINLPAALSGQYELRIIEGDYYFSAVIELE